MGKLFKVYLCEGKVWSCFSCSAHLAYHEDIISKNFQGKHGRAFLIDNVINVRLGNSETRQLMTGFHTVSDIHCIMCDSVLGWKYMKAFEEAQKYKENKFLVEKAKIARDKSWT